MSEINVEYRDPNKLTPYANNSKAHPVEQVDAIASSIAEYGFNTPLVINSEGIVLSGHGRLEAARRLGLKGVPVVVKDDLTPTQQKGYRISDNKTNESQWLEDRLVHELRELSEQDFDLAKTGFSNEELSDLLDLVQEEVDPESLSGDPNADRPVAEPRVKIGDIWQVGNQTIVCADASISSNWEAVMKGRDPINLVFTSPPYASQRTYDEQSEFKPIPSSQYVQWFKPFQENIQTYLASDGSFCINIKEHCEDGQRSLYVSDLKISMVRQWGWRWIDELIWNKNGFPGHWDYRLRDDFERVFHFAVDKPKFFADAVARLESQSNTFYSEYSSSTQGQVDASRNYKEKTLNRVLTGNVIKIAVESEQSGHPASFPVDLPQFFIKAFTEVGDLVVDCFSGSGTTMLSAKSLNRQGVGFEISTLYCDIAIDRLATVTQETPKKIGNV